MKRPLYTVPPVQAVVVMVVVSLPQDEMDDCALAPSAGVVPSGVETRVVTGVQVSSVLARLWSTCCARKSRNCRWHSAL